MTRRSSHLSDALDSLVVPSSYTQVALQPFQRTLGYLCWLIVWSAVATTTVAQMQFARWLQRDAETWLTRLPEVRIEQGVATSPSPQPWRLEIGESSFAFIVDTTGRTTEVDARYPQGILLTQRQLLVKRGIGRIISYDLARVQSFTFNVAVARRWLHQWLWVGPVVVWMFAALYLVLAKPVQVLCFSLWSVLISGFLGRGWRYQSLMTMGVYALTGPALVNALMTVVTPAMPLAFGSAIISGVYVAYLTLAATQPRPGMDEDAS